MPVYTVKGLFTTCVPQFLEHAAGIHPPDAGSDVRMSPAGGRPFSSPYPLAVCSLWALQWHFVCASKYRNKMLLHRTALSWGRGFVRIIYARGPITRHFTNIHIYIHLPRFRLHTARSLASLPAQQLFVNYNTLEITVSSEESMVCKNWYIFPQQLQSVATLSTVIHAERFPCKIAECM